MLLGLVTDIHNDHDSLRRALEKFRACKVEQVVTIGDSCDAYAPADGADEVAELLSFCNAVGVWGNHDYVICNPDNDHSGRGISPATSELMQRMLPSLVVDGCLFTHRESNLDPNDLEQLWAFAEHRDDFARQLKSAYAANQFRRQFIGHYHQWWAGTPDGPLDWDGSSELDLSSTARSIVIIGANFQGHCAVYDSELEILFPHEV